MPEPEPTAIHGDVPAAATQQGLLDRKELSSFAFQRTRMPMVVADARKPNYPIVLANDSFLALTGYTADEVLGRNCRFLQGKNTSSQTVSEIREALDLNRDLTIEILNYKKDGTPFWNQLHLSALRDDAGDVAYVFASQIDVSEYRRIQTLEEAEHRLLLEVNHRTKNVLAIVDSIVRLSRSDNASAYSASVQQRVQALSRTHMLLAEKGWQEVQLGDIVNTQLSGSANERVSTRGPVIMVPAPSVQPIGLAIHELASNAAKHGSLSIPRGRLEIEWIQKGSGVALEWHEIDSPAREGRSEQGFGNVLLGAVVEKQLGGSITRVWKDDGLTVRIELPSLDRVGRDMPAKP